MVKKKLSNQSGQVLLMLILISSVLLTVGLSMSQVGVNETKISKLEEESKKAFQAAEAGIEQTIEDLKDSPNTPGIETPINLNQVNVTTKVTNSNADDPNSSIDDPRYFKTPLVKKDDQFTFFLTKYDPTSSDPWSTDIYNGNLNFYLNSNNKTNCGAGRDVPAIELTYIYGDTTFTTEKYMIDPLCNAFNEPANRILTTVDNTSSIAFFSDFKQKTNETLNINSGNNPKIIVARVLYSDTMIGFLGDNPLKEQGKFITSTATSTSNNVTKKIELFQSLPQIPADFFVTSF
jgi:hypothetical protein